MAEEKASPSTNPASPGNGNGQNGKRVKILTCVDCGEEFVFTVGAQDYFEEKGWGQEPKRCKVCHQKKKPQHPHPDPPAKPEDSYRVVKDIRNPQGLKKAW